MTREGDDTLDPTRPTLIVRHGNTRRKHRRLEDGATILGRAPGCDLGLTAPDVAPVHCVIVRTDEGWRVRDCTGRGATRLNGRSVRDELLRDEDVLQIGGFSFALHLPPERRRRPTSPADGGDEELLTARQEELDRQSDELDAMRNELDSRLAEMRRTQQEIANERAALQKRQEQAEMELSAMREAVAETARRLEIRAGELARYAEHLNRIHKFLRPAEGPPVARDTVVDMPSPLRPATPEAVGGLVNSCG